jgi:transcriptional regulator with XRE-family HTH domain
MSTSSVHTTRAQTSARNLRKLLLDVMAGEPPPLSRRIREERERQEITQEEAARRLHLSLGGYTAYERFREPKPARAREIAAALGLPADHFETNSGPTEQDDQLAVLQERFEVADDKIDRLTEMVEELLRRAG